MQQEAANADSREDGEPNFEGCGASPELKEEGVGEGSVHQLF